MGPGLRLVRLAFALGPLVQVTLPLDRSKPRLASFDDFRDERREFIGPLNPGGRRCDVLNHMVFVGFENRAGLSNETLRISVIIPPVSGDKSADTVRYPGRALQAGG